MPGRALGVSRETAATDIFHQLRAAGLVTGPATLLVLLAAVGTRSAEIITSAASWLCSC